MAMLAKVKPGLREIHPPRSPISQRGKEQEHRYEDGIKTNHGRERLDAQVRILTWTQAGHRGGDGDGVVDRFGQDEVEHCSGDERGAEVRGEVMMDEQLSIHQVEWEIMISPCDPEQTRRIPEAVADGYTLNQSCLSVRVGSKSSVE
jgi:hypothetical protein